MTKMTPDSSSQKDANDSAEVKDLPIAEKYYLKRIVRNGYLGH